MEIQLSVGVQSIANWGEGAEMGGRSMQRKTKKTKSERDMLQVTFTYE